MKKLILLSLLSVIMAGSMAQLKSPEQFLGYTIGTRYTPHYQIVNYFQYIAAQVPDIVKLQKYGETNEHRPLYLSFISSKENISRLEQIRMNNLALAHLGNKASPPTEETPAIVWLSYNVHGNETSSSEAAMLTLYALADPSNSTTKEWLKNTLIIIDPCLNPDGRDRYVNWYNTMIGKNFNPLIEAREHREAWPGGRSNHYNYDLNRDWAWQTQRESKQRVAQYNKWLPQVHVDYHEQSVNAPYYFAPAAEPYHEVLTKWQRDFQKVIGKNNASYFDKNGWLYFSNERFDLFYPSYGDTYPAYNGSIGMTYEQGGISAGLGIMTAEGDTLTLVERALHHYTSGISTIEISSKNASRLIKEFHNYFNDAVKGKIGEYKTYVIKNLPADVERINSLKKLLDNNEIFYGTAAGDSKGYNYHNKKEENFSYSNGDLLISSSQPKAAMVKVLFEPLSKLADSITYDITAWSLPYVYGLQAYATKQIINVRPLNEPEFIKNDPADSYGYIIKWQGITSAKTVTQLLKKGIKLRFSEIPFEVNGQSFPQGSVIITKKGNAQFSNQLWEQVAAICDANKIKMNAVTTGMVDKGADFGSTQAHQMKAAHVAMLTGDGINANAAGEIWSFFDNELEYPLSLLNVQDFDRIKWNAIDVLILPDGKYPFLDKKEDAAQFQQWIEKGGKVIALERAVKKLSEQKWSTLKAKSDSLTKDTISKKNPYDALKIYGSRERDEVSDNTPGAIYKVDVDNTHPLMFGYPEHYYTLKMDSVIYHFIQKDGWNVGVIKKENLMAGYVGYKLNPKLKDGLLFGVQKLKKGNVIYLTDDIMFRTFWENGKLMLCNAIFMVGE